MRAAIEAFDQGADVA
ncbi:MAG: hypothetical protein ACRDNH_02865, partial [Gaiellaceae bacterium]